MTLDEWAAAWGIPPGALLDLKLRFRAVRTEPDKQPGTSSSETDVQTRVRLEATQKGLRLWRNNVGVTEDHIRYGLANDSARMNKIIKSSDLIGIRPVTIQPHMVGTTLGQFVAREVKKGGWRWGGTERELAQLKFLELVASLGGDACFCNEVGTL